MPSLIWDLIYRDRGVQRGLNQVADAQEKAERRAQAWRKAAAAGFVVVAAAAVKWGKDSVQAYGESQAAQAKLSDAFSRFPRLADTNQAALQRLNAERQKSTRFDDDATAAAQAQLAQYKLTGTQLRELTPLLQDYAAKTGKDITAAANDAGKAVLGQGRAFKSIGLNLKDTGSQTDNYTQLVAGLRTQVGGFAEKEGKTAAGAFAILQNQVGELQEQTGEHLVPALTAGLEGLTDFVEVVGENSDVIVPLVAGVGGLTGALWLGHKAAKAYAAMQGIMGAAMASNSRVATSLASVVGKAGPWGVAIAGGATLLGVFAGQQAAAERETKAFTDSLTFQKGALDANSRQMLVQKLANEGVLEASKAAGLSEQNYVKALLEGGPAREAAIRYLNYAGQAARENVEALRGNVTEQEAIANSAFAAADQLKLMGGGLDASKRAAELADAAFKGSSDSTDEQKESAEKAAQRLRELAEAMFRAGSAALALSGSQIGFEQAVDDATAAAKKNGKTLDTNTQKGRDNRTALNNLATASQAYISKLVETNASSKKVAGATRDARAEFIKVAEKMGVGRDRAKELADKYGLIPKKVETKVDQPGMKTAKSDTTILDRKINDLNSKNVSINYKTNAGTLAKSFGVSVRSGVGRTRGDGSRGQVPRYQVGADRPAVTESHGHGDAEGGPAITRKISTPVHGRPARPEFDTISNRLSKNLGQKLGAQIGERLDKAIAAAPSAPGTPGTGPGSPIAVGRGWGPIYAAMRRHGARSFTTYPGHHPSAARARDVTPHNWAAANAARRLSSVWYVIYRMRIASKSPGRGNVWRPYRPTNFRGDWRHVRHIHVARYEKGTSSARRGFAVVGESGPELLQMRGGERVTPAQKIGRPSPVAPAGIDGPLELSDRTIRKIGEHMGQVVLAGIGSAQRGAALTAGLYSRGG